MVPKYSLVLEIDLYGQILTSYHDAEGKIGIISQVFQYPVQGGPKSSNNLFLIDFQNVFF